MTALSPALRPVGQHLRDWRQRRRMSQLASRKGSDAVASGRGGSVSSTWKGRLVSEPVGTSSKCCLPARSAFTGSSSSL